MTPEYYTPTIEEFHVGFEYESFRKLKWDDINAQWLKETIDGETRLMRLMEYIDSGRIRVKKLDHADLLECRWLKMKEEMYRLGSTSPDPKYQPTLLFKDNAGFWVIETDGNEYMGRVFRGAIRNKSELLQVMKMVGIKE